MDARVNIRDILSILLVLCAFAVVSGVLTGKAFYCRDPDTGKLYPVNSTWHSSSFCGRYTCKLRKKTSDNPAQIVPALNKNNEKADSSATPITRQIHRNCSQPAGVVIEDKVTSDIQKILHKPKDDTYVSLEKFQKVENVKNVDLDAKTADGDRYLTEEEIKALSLLLQTMKKSDLEAILEVYNLAQDIYKEIDKVTEENNNKNYTQDRKMVSKDEKLTENEIPDDIKTKKIVSYWYEPLTPINSKLKASEVIQTSQEQKIVKPPRVKPNIDANLIPKSFYEGLNLLEEAKNKNKLFESVPNTRILDKSYKEAPLARADFRKLPYYHPLTNFQKQVSYVHPITTYSQSNPALIPIPQSTDYTQQRLYAQPAIYSPALLQLQQYPQLPLYPQQHKEDFVQQQNDKSALPIYSPNRNVASSENHGPNGKCCKNHLQEPPFRLIPWTKKIEDKKPINNMKYEDSRSLYRLDKMYNTKSAIPYSESKINPNFDLPTAYARDYNVSSIQPYTLESTWRLLGLSDKIPRRNKPAIMGAPFLAQAPSKLAANSEESPDVNDEDQELVQNAKNETPDLHDWQTPQLPLSVINEVKADIGTSKFLPYPFRKKIKLERLGKLLQVNDAGRIKRDVAEIEKRQAIIPEEYEVYIEKSTCETDTEPGFFRMGNSTEPYPACCPQRIHS